MTKYTFFIHTRHNRAKYHSKGPMMIMPGRALCGHRMQDGHNLQLERTLIEARLRGDVCKSCLNIIETLVIRGSWN